MVGGSNKLVAAVQFDLTGHVDHGVETPGICPYREGAHAGSGIVNAAVDELLGGTVDAGVFGVVGGVELVLKSIVRVSVAR